MHPGGPQPFSLQSTYLIGYMWAWIAWPHTHHHDGLGTHTHITMMAQIHILPGCPGHTHISWMAWTHRHHQDDMGTCVGWKHRKRNVNTGTFSIPKCCESYERTSMSLNQTASTAWNLSIFGSLVYRKINVKSNQEKGSALPCKKLTREQNMYPSVIF